MDTEKLMEWADEAVDIFQEANDSNHPQEPIVWALLAIANELKRMNDQADSEAERQELAGSVK